MNTRRSAALKKTTMEDGGSSALDKEIKEEAMDSDDAVSSDGSQSNLLTELQKQFSGSSPSDDTADPFPKDFGVKNLAPRAPVHFTAQLFGAPLPAPSSLNGPRRLQPILPADPMPDRRYTLPAAKPHPKSKAYIAPGPSTSSSSNGIVGSNTSIGPLRLLEQRNKERRGNPYDKRSLETYNGGRPGEQFPANRPSFQQIEGHFDRLESTASAKNLDLHRMLQEQPTVRMEVKVDSGAAAKEQLKMPKEEFPKEEEEETAGPTTLIKVGAVMIKKPKVVGTLRLGKAPKQVPSYVLKAQKEPETPAPKKEKKRIEEAPKELPTGFADRLKNAVDELSEESSTQDVLIASMVVNALTKLKNRRNHDHANFSADVFDLFVKYGIE